VGQGPGQHYPLLLASRKLPDLLYAGCSVNLHFFHGFLYFGFVLGVGPMKPAHMDIAAHHHHILHAHWEIPVDGVFLRDDRYPVTAAVGFRTINVDFALLHFDKAED
jgi:hypothetical protein